MDQVHDIVFFIIVPGRILAIINFIYAICNRFIVFQILENGVHVFASFPPAIVVIPSHAGHIGNTAAKNAKLLVYAIIFLNHITHRFTLPFNRLFRPDVKYIRDKYV